MPTINLRASAMKWVIICCATIAFLAQSPQPLFPQGRLSVVYPEDSRPPLAFREDWQDDWNDGEPLARLNDYHDTDLDAHLQNRGLRHAWYGPGRVRRTSVPPIPIATANTRPSTEKDGSTFAISPRRTIRATCGRGSAAGPARSRCETTITTSI